MGHRLGVCSYKTPGRGVSVVEVRTMESLGGGLYRHQVLVVYRIRDSGPCHHFSNSGNVDLTTVVCVTPTISVPREAGGCQCHAGHLLGLPPRIRASSLQWKGDLGR